MARSLNRVQIIGNLGADPEIRSFSNGGQCANLSIAVTETWRDKQSGEKKEKTEWVRVSVFSEGLVRVCEQYLTKGSKVYVEGKFSTRKWQDQLGQDRYSTEVIIQGFGGQIIMLGGNGQGDNQGGGQSQGQSSYGDQSQSSGYGGSSTGPEPNDFEIPF